MTPRSLFNIILKVLGIFFIVDFLAAIAPIFSVILVFTTSDSFVLGLGLLFIIVLTLLAYGVVAYYLIFKTEMIIDKLKLDKGFDQETIPLNIQRSVILSISIIVIGGLLVIDGIPDFCQRIFSYFQEKHSAYIKINSTIVYLVVSGLKIIIGLFLLTQQRKIVNYIERNRKE